jgi:hypothetical protein
VESFLTVSIEVIQVTGTPSVWMIMHRARICVEHLELLSSGRSCFLQRRRFGQIMRINVFLNIHSGTWSSFDLFCGMASCPFAFILSLNGQLLLLTKIAKNLRQSHGTVRVSSGLKSFTPTCRHRIVSFVLHLDVVQCLASTQHGHSAQQWND